MKPNRNRQLRGTVLFKLKSTHPKTLLTLLSLVCAGLIVSSQFVAQSPGQTSPQSRATNVSGRRIFASNCAGCHGLDGLGGERAPNIATNPQVQRLSETQLSRIVSDGVPGTGMPSFRALGASQIKAVAGYLKSLQGNKLSAALPGDPQRGKTIFFGDAGCSSCHMTAGTGGFIGPDLTAYAHTRSAEKIKTAITNPSERDSTKSTVTAITADGQRYHGVVRNEDNFSLQLQSTDGTFHFLSKANLTTVERGRDSIMPSDYGTRLNPGQLNDLVSYLISVARKAKPAPVRENDEE